MSSIGRTWRRALAVVAVGAAVAALAGGPGGPAPGTAASPFVAGQPSTARATATGPVAAVYALRAAADRVALGLPDGSQVAVATVTDRFLSSTYTEVTVSDPKVGPVAMARYDGDGRLLGAVRFGWHDQSAAPLASAGVALARAAAALRAVGLGRADSGIVSPGVDQSWVVSWIRTAGGHPVVGDGVRVTLFADGTLHALARSERALEASPPVLLPEAAAHQLAGRQLDAWVGGTDRDRAVISGATLAWVAPNDAFAPAGPDAPAAVLRLAWVVSVRAEGTLAERFRALELYLDAGDGALLGGDVLR